MCKARTRRCDGIFLSLESPAGIAVAPPSAGRRPHQWVAAPHPSGGCQSWRRTLLYCGVFVCGTVSGMGGVFCAGRLPLPAGKGVTSDRRGHVQRLTPQAQCRCGATVWPGVQRLGALAWGLAPTAIRRRQWQPIRSRAERWRPPAACWPTWAWVGQPCWPSRHRSACVPSSASFARPVP
jgi:hypothetical protein